MARSLFGVYDLHVHTSPDVKPRKVDDITYVRKCIDAGFAGALLKNHMAPTVARAGVVRQFFPGFDINGGVVLNPSVGGLNPLAVETAAKMGGRIVWFPTLYAKEYTEFKGVSQPNAIDVTDGGTGLSAEAVEVLRTAARVRMTVATGHLAQRNAALVAEEAFAQGIQRVLFTHINHPNSRLDRETERRFRDMGAYFELYRMTSINPARLMAKL